jgi:hypothetical protein
MSLSKILALLGSQYRSAKKLGGSIADDYFYSGMTSKGFDALPPNLASLPAHGMTKGTPNEVTENLLRLLTKGTDPKRGGGVLYSAPLRGSKEAASALGTAGGSAYREGPFQLIGKQGAELKGDLKDLIAIAINPSYPPEARRLLVELIQGLRPGLKVGTYDELPTLLSSNPLNHFKVRPLRKGPPNLYQVRPVRGK